MKPDLKRISLMLREDQYEQLGNSGLNVSGLIRDLIDDYLSEHKITLAVTQETRELYDMIIANTGSSDTEVEVYLKEGLRQLLKKRIESMKILEKKLDEEC